MYHGCAPCFLSDTVLSPSPLPPGENSHLYRGPRVPDLLGLPPPSSWARQSTPKAHGVQRKAWTRSHKPRLIWPGLAASCLRGPGLSWVTSSTERRPEDSPPVCPTAGAGTPFGPSTLELPLPPTQGPRGGQVCLLGDERSVGAQTQALTFPFVFLWGCCQATWGSLCQELENPPMIREGLSPTSGVLLPGSLCCLQTPGGQRFRRSQRPWVLPTARPERGDGAPGAGQAAVRAWTAKQLGGWAAEIHNKVTSGSNFTSCCFF